MPSATIASSPQLRRAEDTYSTSAAMTSAAGRGFDINGSSSVLLIPYLAACQVASLSSAVETGGGGSPAAHSAAAISTSPRHSAATRTASRTSTQMSATLISTVGYRRDQRAS